MKKVVAMIPARLGSKRVPKKNLRFLDGKPLISYIIESVKATNIFDAIYLNSEADIFENIAKDHGINFYKRDPEFASDSATNDLFGLDFLQNIHTEILIQILPTSPFLSPEEIIAFTQKMIQEDLDTLISVEHKQIASLYKEQALNFDPLKVNPPSQTMEPIKVYATALMGWKSDVFQNNMKKYASAYHGGDGKTDFFELRGLATIDIDREDDFLLAESLMKAKKQMREEKISYYGESEKEHSEAHVESILKKDGVAHNDLYDVNNEIVALETILSSMDASKSWSKRVIDTESNSMTIISQLPGEGNRLHYHPDWNEWWYIVDGMWQWDIEGEKKVVKKGDIVFMRKNRRHKITAIGDKPAIRMAVSRADVAHVYPEDE